MKKSEAQAYVKKEYKVSRQQMLNQEYVKNKCDHKIGADLKLKECGNGVVKCKLCGVTFSVNEILPQDLMSALGVVRTAVQCIKLKGETETDWSLPAEAIHEWATLLTQLELIPDIYKTQFIDRISGNSFNSRGFEQKRQFTQNQFSSSIMFSDKQTDVNEYMNSIMSSNGKGKKKHDKKHHNKKKNSW